MNNYRQVFSRVICISLIFVWIASCTHSKVDADKLSDVVQTGTILANDISEASGLAASNIDNDVYWINNDSWNTSSLFAVNSKGEKLAELQISGEINNDWEDLATFRKNGKSYIVIGDVGDNDANRQYVSLIFIEEPEINLNKTHQILAAKPAWKIHFVYEDGPRDVESLAVDENSGKILLLSKRDEVPVLYDLPLILNTNRNLVAKRLGEIKPLPKPHERYFRILDVLGLTRWPTGMDISADGKSLAVLTYGDAYLYTKSDDTSWLSAMQQTPEIIPLPELKQGEAIGFDKTERHLYITTEKLPAPVICVDVDKVRSDNYLLANKKQRFNCAVFGRNKVEHQASKAINASVNSVVELLPPISRVSASFCFRTASIPARISSCIIS